MPTLQNVLWSVLGIRPWAKSTPAIIQIWERAWAQVIPFFQFAPEIRTQIYTINSIEGLNRAVRKVIKTRTLFPNEEAAKKLIYLAIMNFTASWKRLRYPSGLLPCPSSLCCLVSGLLVSWSKLTRLPLRGAR